MAAGRWEDALDSAVEAVDVLEGLPESPELARALARLSQIEMLRSLPSEDDGARAIEVARRTGEPAAEANARINLLTAHARTGDVAQPAEWSAVIDHALVAGAHDESVRAIVNYLWTAATIGRLDEAERFVENVPGVWQPDWRRRRTRSTCISRSHPSSTSRPDAGRRSTP